MKHVTFKIPCTRIPQATFGLSTADENFFKVLWESFRLKREYLMDAGKKFDSLTIYCSTDQFAAFIITRNKYGVANWIKELEAKIVEDDAPETTNRIDVTEGTPHMKGKFSWRNAMHFTGDPIDATAMSFHKAEAILPMGHVVKLHPEYFQDGHRVATRDEVLEEVAKVFDERETNIRADMSPYERQASWRVVTAKRHAAVARLIRSMKGGKPAATAEREATIQTWRDSGRKFNIRIDGLWQTAYFVESSPPNIIKIDGSKLYYDVNDERVDWSRVRGAIYAR